ncbi:MAG: sulfatase family protein [Acidobacteriota bacterium]
MCAPAQTDERPNFILLMGDDHGWEETGYNGHPYLQTPVLDEMAATGLRLDRFYAAAPVCSPTRGSVLTGRHPNRYGTFGANSSIRPEEISIAHILGRAGYACGHFGKWHVGPVKAESPTSPGAMGFEEWVSHDNFFEMNPPLSRNGGPPEVFEGEGSEILIAEAIRFIEKAKESERPFFVVVWFASPHEPYSGLEKDLRLYDDLPESYQDQLVTLTSMQTGSPVQRPQREVLRERYAEITAMDRAIGQLRKQLDEMGLRENTLLWYCGDNGTPTEGVAASRLRGHKGAVYEGGVRVPGVIEWPAGIREPRVSDVNAVTSDILPTLSDLAGQPIPARPLDGITLKPLIDGNMTERPSPISFWSFDGSRRRDEQWKPYIDPELQKGTTPLVKLMDGIPTRNFRNYHYPGIVERDFGGRRAILENRYKLVLDAGETARELFDVRSDPAEEHNLIETHPEIADALARQLRDWQQSVLESLTDPGFLAGLMISMSSRKGSKFLTFHVTSVSALAFRAAMTINASYVCPPVIPRRSVSFNARHISAPVR